MVDLFGGPAADLTTAVQEDLEEADDAGVVDLDQSLLEMEIGEVVGHQLVAQEGGELFVLL